MILVRILLKVKPENQLQFISTMSEDTAVSRGYAGCQRFDLFQDVSDDCAFVLYEEWASQPEFDAYRQSDYLKERGGAIFPLLDGSPDTAYFEASILAQ